MQKRFNKWEEKYQQHGAVQTEPMQIVQEAVSLLKKRKAKKILDLACGTGRHTVFLAQKGFHVTGIDDSKTALQITRKQLEKKRVKNVRVCFGRIQQIPFNKESFDAVVCTRAIYHGTSKQIQKALAEVYRVLQPKGLFVFNVLTTNHPDFGKGKRIEKNTFVHVHDSEYGVPHHFFSKKEIQRLLIGFNILCLNCVHYPDLSGKKPHEFEIIAEKDEVFEYFSVRGKKLGLATRKKIHESKRVYKAAHVLVFNSKGELFVQERAKTKDVYPGFFAPSASGHHNPNENQKQAALRELQEELGIKPKIVLLGKIKCFTPIIRELLTVFMAKTNQRIRFNKNEIENGFFVPLDWAYKNLKNKKFLPSLKKELIVFKKKITKKLYKKKR